jgi:ketol-acid reductoisomerase
VAVLKCRITNALAHWSPPANSRRRYRITSLNKEKLSWQKLILAAPWEEVVTREEFPLEKAREVLKDEVVAVLGYGVQGPAQALNMRDNGINVIVGQRGRDIQLGQGRRRRLGSRRDAFRSSKKPWNAARSSSTCSRMPAAQPVAQDRRALKPGDAVFLARLLGHRYKRPDRRRAAPACRRDLVAPKGSGTQRARQLPGGSGINASFAVHQDYTGRAMERTIALGIAIGSGYLFPTTFRKRSLQRPDRRARHPDGRAGGRDGSAVQHCCAPTATARARPSTRPSKN